MRVKLLSCTANPLPVMYVAARTCYSSKSPIELSDELLDRLDNFVDEDGIDYQDKMWSLVGSVLESGHMSIAEHVNFTFAIEGISRACSHQLVRHRLCTFSQQSQRYVEIKEEFSEIYDLVRGFPTDEKIIKMKELAEKYFVDVDDNNYYGYVNSLCEYARRVSFGEKAEDARNSLPNATKTNIVLTTNLRNLIHICELRLCNRAQKEIRNLFKLMVDEVMNENKHIGSLLMCQCDRLGYCPEANKCCGRKPNLRKLLEKKREH